MLYKSILLVISMLFTLSACFFFRKDKDPEKLVKDWNSVVDEVIEQVDSLEEKAKKTIEEELDNNYLPIDSIARDSID